MADEDITIKIPRRLNDDVVRFTETNRGKRFTNRTDFFKCAIRKLLEEYEGRPRFEYIGRDENERIIIRDSSNADIITLEIKKGRKDNILVCNTCVEFDGDDCPHRKFVLKHEGLWDYLKTNDVKILRVRDGD